MKKVYGALFAFLCMSSAAVKAQEQFFSTVDITANILDMSYDKQLPAKFNTGVTITSGVRATGYSASSWTATFNPFLWLKLNKTVSCGGQDVENFVVLPLSILATPSNYASSFPDTPWYAASSGDDYPTIRSLFTSAYLSNAQIKITRIFCGSSQLHPIKKTLVPVAYIQGFDYSSVLPPANNSLSQSAWINGVQVSTANAAPTNAITTMWNFSVPATGTYDVYVHWVSNKNAVSAISYGVDGQVLKNVALDQNINAGIWVKLVKAASYPAGNHTLNLSIDSTANYVVDGVKVEKTAP